MFQTFKNKFVKFSKLFAFLNLFAFLLCNIVYAKRISLIDDKLLEKKAHSGKVKIIKYGKGISSHLIASADTFQNRDLSYIKIWDIEAKGKKIKRIITDEIQKLDWSPCGRYLGILTHSFLERTKFVILLAKENFKDITIEFKHYISCFSWLSKSGYFIIPGISTDDSNIIHILDAIEIIKAKNLV